MKLDISKLKKISSSTLSTIAAKENKTSYVDDRFWKPELDSAGNGKAVIRILPSIREGELPWAEQWSYAVKGSGGWYIETSLRTVNKPDPMAEYIASRWKQAVTEADKQALRSAGLSKARHQYIANILVVNDPAHPENNGKVFLWRFGQKIFEMITDKAKPDAFDETQGNINVTDWDAGCNFRLIVYTQDRFPRYDKSQFESQSSIGNDATIVSIADKMYDLGEFTDPSKLKDYDTLKARRDRVFNLTTSDFESAPREQFTPSQAAKPTFGQPMAAPVAQSTIAPQQPVIKPVVQPTADVAPWQTSAAKPSAAPASELDDIDFDALMADI